MNNENVFAANIFVDFDEYFHVGESFDAGIGRADIQVCADTFRKWTVAVSCYYFHATIFMAIFM